MRGLSFRIFILFAFVATSILSSCTTVVRERVVTTDAGIIDPGRLISGTLPIIYYAANGDVGRVQTYIDNGANPDVIYYSRSYEATPLQAAVKKGNIQIAQILINEGADVNAIANDKTALEMAVARKNYDFVRFLTENGAELNGPSILQDSVGFDTRILAYLLSSGAGNRSNPVCARDADIALLKAVRGGFIPAANMLLDAGADVDFADEYYRNALFYAAQQQDAMLLGRVYAVSRNGVNVMDKSGMTPLMWAAEKGRMDNVRFLVSKGAYVDITDNNQRNAISYAATNLVVAKYLAVELLRNRKPANSQIMRLEQTRYEVPKRKENVNTAVLKRDVQAPVRASNNVNNAANENYIRNNNVSNKFRDNVDNNTNQNANNISRVNNVPAAVNTDAARQQTQQDPAPEATNNPDGNGIKNQPLKNNTSVRQSNYYKQLPTNDVKAPENTDSDVASKDEYVKNTSDIKNQPKKSEQNVKQETKNTTQAAERPTKKASNTASNSKTKTKNTKKSTKQQPATQDKNVKKETAVKEKAEKATEEVADDTDKNKGNNANTGYGQKAGQGAQQTDGSRKAGTDNKQ